MKIGELARRAHCQVETIRYYEREKLLPEPNRSVGNFRLYGPAHHERLAFIRRCRSLGMPLVEIRALLEFRDSPHGNCGAVNELLDAHIRRVMDRIGEMRALEKQLKKLRRLCPRERPAESCEILKSLARTAE